MVGLCVEATFVVLRRSQKLGKAAASDNMRYLKKFVQQKIIALNEDSAKFGQAIRQYLRLQEKVQICVFCLGVATKFCSSWDDAHSSSVVHIRFAEHSSVLLSWKCRYLCCSVMSNVFVQFSGLSFTTVLQPGEKCVSCW